MDKLRVEHVNFVTLRKCECCGRVRDIPYKVFICDNNSGLYIGDFDMCKDCGDNFAKLIGQEIPQEYSIAEWSFDDGN